MAAPSGIVVAQLAAGGKGRFGIKGRLLLAIGIVAAMTLMGGVLSWHGYAEVERLLAGMTRDNLPGVSMALELSDASGRLASAAAALDAADTQERRQTAFAAVTALSRRLTQLIDRLENAGVAQADIANLRLFAGAADDNARGRNDLVEERLRLAGRKRAEAAELSRIDDILDEIGDHDRRNLAVGDMMAIVEIMHEVLSNGDIERAGMLRRSFDERARRLVLALAQKRLAGGDLTEIGRQLLDLAGETGPDDIFEGCSRLLVIEQRLASAGEEGRQIESRISEIASRLVDVAKAEANSNEAAAEEAIAQGRRLQAATALATFLGPLLFLWLYLGKGLVARLADLSRAMHRILEGDFKTPISQSGHPGGNDEIADMAAKLVVFRDVMAGVQANSQALKESERRLRTILDTSPLALGISRVGDHRLLYVNPRWCDLFQVAVEIAVGNESTGFFADPGDCRKIAEHVAGQGYLADFESRMRRADGSEFWAALSGAAFDIDGAPAVIVSCMDITRRKDEENALAQAKKLAEEASEAKSLFLATMSHEIRTPMNGVLTMAQLLDDMPLPSEHKEVARVIRDSAMTLLTIINDILDFSKIEAGRMTLEMVETAPVEVIEGVAELLAPRAVEKGIELIAFVDPALPEKFLADPVRLRQIITNLAGNAVKFTDRGQVRLDVEAVAEANGPMTVVFSVTDTGIGLDEDAQARLFLPFSQADASISRRYGGTGLGLSICRRLVEMMGGRIGVISRPGEGATFRFELPLDAVAPTPEVAPDLTGVGVLVLAEGPAGAEAVRRYLVHASAQVAVVATPDGALAAVRAASLAGWSYDVVLLDGGPDFAARVAVARAVMATAGSAAATRVVMVASHANFSSAAAAAREAGLFATLSKPIHRTRLWRTVAAAAGRGFLDEDEQPQPRGGDTFIAPSVEEAASAGVLILVAEDNATNQVVIRRLMDRLGYAIDMVANGIEAWGRMQIRDYGLLLTDCHMPEMDGYELTLRVRDWERETHQHIPIVALTADALSGTARKCLDCGMDAFLAKPIDLMALDSTLRRLLPRAASLRRLRVTEPGDGGDTAAPVSLAEEGPPILDLMPMRLIFGGITEEARELLHLFVSSTQPLVEDTRRFLDDGDTAEARETAHAAKGAGNSAGAFRFARYCADIETACAKGDLGTAQHLCPAMEAAFVEASAAVSEL